MAVKIYSSAMDAVADIPNGSTLCIGGFGLCGIPENLIKALVERNVNGLTCVSNNAGVDNYGIGLLFEKRQVKKMISSYVGENATFEKLLLSGELEVELVPQGTLAERIRCGGAGLGGVLTPTGVGTIVEDGKTKLSFDGVEYLVERPLRADIAIIKAHSADEKGNLMYQRAARNFNPLMAMAADYVVAEVDEIVSPIFSQKQANLV